LLVAFDGIVKETVAEGRVAELDSRDGALLGRAGELERSPEQVDRVRVPSALRRRSELKGDDGLELLPTVLRDAEGPTGILSAVAGAIVFAGGAIVGATIHFALADYSNDTDVVDPLVFQALNAFDWSNFLFFPVGLGTMLLASSRER
jgi:hypothetical protein